MKHLSFRAILSLIPTIALICLPLVTLAQGTLTPSSPQGTFTPSSPQGTLTPSQFKLENPLKVKNFCDLLKVLLDAILVIGMPIAVLFLVYVGFKFILARGNPEKLGVAKQNLLYTVIGIAIFLGAWTIAKIIQATLVNLGATAANQC